MAAHSVEISDCDSDIAEVTVRIDDTIQWWNKTSRRVNLVLPHPPILDPEDAQTMIDAGDYSQVYTVMSGNGRTEYKFTCIGPPAELSPRTGTINVEG